MGVDGQVSGSECDNCDRLERRLRVLEEENRLLQLKIDRAKQMAYDWLDSANQAGQPAWNVLSMKSGVAPAVWSRAMGTAEGIEVARGGLGEVIVELE